MGPGRDDLRTFCRANYNRLFQTLAVYLSDDALALEISDRVFTRAAARWWRVGRLGTPAIWLLRTGLRMAESPLRRARLGFGRRAELAPPPPTLEPHLAKARRRIEELPPRPRLALLLNDFWELTAFEIADVMGNDERGAQRLIDRAHEELSSASSLLHEALSGLHAEPDIPRIEGGAHRIYRTRLVSAAGVLVTVALFVGTPLGDALKRLDDRDVRDQTDAEDGVDRIDVGAPAVDVAFEEGRVWVATSRIVGAGLVPVNTATAERGDPLDAPGTPVALAVGDEGLWLLSREDGTKNVVAFDPATGRRIGTARVGSEAASLAVGFGAVWVSGGRTLTRVDAGSGRVTANIEVPQRAGRVVAGAGSVWLGCACSGGSVLRISPETNRVESVLQSLDLQAVATERIWVSGRDVSGAAILTWADPNTLQVRPEGTRIQGDVIASGDDVWIVTSDGGRSRLVHLDPVRRTSIGAPVPLPDKTGPGVFAAGRVWIASGRELLAIEQL